MSTLSSIFSVKAKTAEEVVRELVRVRHSGGSMFVNLPILYPDGSFVTVCIDHSRSGFRVTDSGFTYREVDDLGASRSFRRSANKIAEASGVMVGERVIYAEAGIEELERAICDVAEVSWRIVDSFFHRAFEEEDARLSDELRARLIKVFGAENVEQGATITGASTTDWPISALVRGHGVSTVFQAVSDNANSINRASTAFRDFSALDSAPNMVAFVKSKAALGPRLGLLAPSRVVEEAQSDETLERAAA